jgi:hypothetical protein
MGRPFVGNTQADQLCAVFSVFGVAFRAGRQRAHGGSLGVAIGKGRTVYKVWLLVLSGGDLPSRG